MKIPLNRVKLLKKKKKDVGDYQFNTFIQPNLSDSKSN